MKLLRCYSKNSERSSSGACRNAKFNHILVLIIVLICLEVAECTLTLKKQCGELECPAWQYCSPIDESCRPCSTICDEGYKQDVNRCNSDCQDYLHDTRYQSLQNSTLLEMLLDEKYKKLEDDILILKIIVGACVAVILIVVAILAAFLVYFWKLLHPSEPSSPEEKKQKKGSAKSASSATTVELPTVYNNRYGVTTPTPENSPSSVVSNSPVDTNNTTFSSSTSVPPYHESSRSKSVSTINTTRTSPETVTTTLSSAASTLTGKELSKMNGSVAGSPIKSQTPALASRFRREPSESTLPDNCAYDNLSMSPQHQVYYSHHV